MVSIKNTHLKLLVSSVIIFTFLYSQFLWAIGYELFKYTLDEEDLISGFKSPEEIASVDARKRYLLNRQEEIDHARRLALNWSYPLHEPNKELSRNLAYQQIIATKELTDGKRYADEITGRIGAYGKYYIKHNDGMVTWYFNALLTDIISEKIKDKLGHQSIQDTINMLYNEKRQLVSFKQTLKDERENVTEKIWDSATYWVKADMLIDPRKEKDTLSGYHEKITYPTGEIIDRDVANLTYYTLYDQNLDYGHLEEQIASYDEKKTSNQAQDAPAIIHWYDSNYLKRPHTYTLLDPFDKDKYPDEDERFDILLTGFKEDSTALEVKTSRVWSNPVYNEHEQLTSYHESIDSLGFHTERDFYDAKYDDWGRLTSYREKIDTEGLITERYWHDGKYNNIDQLTYYKEDLFSGGIWTYTTWDSPVYNSIGQLTSYHTVTESGGIEIDTVRSGIIYNKYGLPESYDEVVKSLGMTITTQRRNITYESYGWITGWDDTIREQASYVDETGLVPIDRTYILRRYDMSYYWNGLVSSYRELLIDPLGIATSTYRYDMFYNYQGLLIIYIEEVTKTGLGMDITTKTIRDNIAYNIYGQMTGYHEILSTSETPGLTTEITRSDILYNNEGWVTEYTETVHKYAEDKSIYDTAVTTHRYDIVYNRIGKPTKYREEETNELGTKVTKEWWGGEYNPVGLLIGYYEKAAYPDRTIQVYQYKIIYDSYDRAIGYINEETDQFGVVTKTERKGIKYIGQLQNYYIDKILRTGAGLNQEWEKIWEGEYNSISQVIKYKEIATDPFGVRTVLEMLGMEYNVYGQLVKYKGITTRGADYMNTRDWAGGYNSKNMLNTFTEISATTDGIMKLSAKTERKSTEYNELGYIKSYSEEIIDDSSPDKTTERKMYDATYEKGLLKTYTQEETALGVTKTTKRKDTQFNSIGQEIGYTDETIESNSPDKVTTITRTGMTYTEKGRMEQYDEEYKETGLNLNYTKTTLRRNMLYNDVGYLLSYNDTITETSVQDVQTTKKWSGTYNSLGILIHYDETTKSGDRAEVIVTRDIVYEINGLQKKYTEVIDDKATPDKTTTKIWEASSYKTNGQIDGYREITIEEGLDLDILIEKVVIRSNMGYTNNLLTSYNEIINDSSIPLKKTENTWTAAYNTLGQVDSYTQISEETSTQPDVVEWHKVTSQIRSNIKYDDQGREYSYIHKELDSGDSETANKIITTTRTETLYNGSGLMSEYYESQNYKGNPIKDLDKDMDYTLNIVRKDTKYNSDEQVISYTEETINETDSPDKKTIKKWSTDPNDLEQGYNAIGQIKGDVVETKEENTEGSSEKLDVTTIEKRTDLKYDDIGRLISYTKITESDSSADLEGKTIWKGAYNGLGLITNYKQIEINYNKPIEGVSAEGEKYKIQTISERKNITYTDTGLVIGYIDKQVDVDPDMVFALGLDIDIDSIELKNIHKTVDTTWEAEGSDYNVLGLLTGYTQIVNEEAIARDIETGKIIIDSGIGGILVNTEMGIIKINSDNDNLIMDTKAGTIKETRKDPETGVTLARDITVSLLTGIEIGGTGFPITYAGEIIMKKVEGSDTVNVTINPGEGKIEIDLDTGEVMINSAPGQPKIALDVEKTAERKDIIYHNGEITGYTEIQKDNVTALKTTTLKWGKNTGEYTESDRLYNEIGRLSTYAEEYHETGTDNDGNILDKTTKIRHNDIVYDEKGRIYSYEKITIDSGGLVETIWRQNTMYNSLGQVGNFGEQIKRSTQAGLSITHTFSDAVYNRRGLIFSYLDVFTDTPGSGRSIKLTNIVYNVKNQIVSYHQEIKDQGITTITDWQTDDLNGYNDSGQLKSFHEEITTSIAKGITTVRERTILGYNSDNRIEKYRDIMEEKKDGVVVKTFTVDWEATDINAYDEKGNLKLFKEKTTTDTVEIIRERTDTVYDNDSNLIKEYSETITATGSGFTNTVNINRFDIKYDAFSRLSSYVEEKTQDGLTTKTEWSGADYDNSDDFDKNGQLLGYTETKTMDGLKKVTVRSNMKYDIDGQLIGYSDLIHNFGALSDEYKVDVNDDGIKEGEDLDTWELVERNGIEYEYGNIKTFNEDSSKSNINGERVGEVTHTERRSTEYLNNGDLTSYIEQITNDKNDITINNAVSNIEIDPLGRLINSKTETAITGTLADDYKILEDSNDTQLQLGENLNQKTVTERHIDKFKGDRIEGYIDIVYDSSGAEKLTKSKVENVTFNNLGQIWSSKNSSYNYVDGEAKITSIEWIKESVYSNDGQLLGSHVWKEDASLEKSTPWIKYDLTSSEKINKLIIKNLTGEEIASGRLVFSDGSIVYFSKISPGEVGLEIKISDRTIDSVILQVYESGLDTIRNSDIKIELYYIPETRGEDINRALDSTPTVSSEFSDQNSAWKSIDGNYGMWDSGEWASSGENTPWIQFNWDTTQRINKIVLYNRPNEYDQIKDARLVFSDGSSILVGGLLSGGDRKEVFFPEKNITWVRFEVLEAGDNWKNIGLSEFQAYYIPSNELPENIAKNSHITRSSAYPGYEADKTVDNYYGLWDFGEWGSFGEPLPWIQYSWDIPQTINKITIFDRPNKYDNVLSAKLLFSDGSGIDIGKLPVDGSGKEITFGTKTVSWVKLEVLESEGPNPGISEFMVQYVLQGQVEVNIAVSASINASSEFSDYFGAQSTTDGIYGQWNSGEWASSGEKTPWIEYIWDTPQKVNKITLYSRPNRIDGIIDSELIFSDGSRIHTGMLTSGGGKKDIVFQEKTITSVRFNVLKGSDSTQNNGLAEFIVQHIHEIPPANLAQNALIDSSSEHISQIRTEQWNYNLSRNEKGQVEETKTIIHKYNIVPLTPTGDLEGDIRNIDQWQEINLEGIEYNNLGQTYSYKKTVASTDDAITSTTDRNATVYNSLGLESGYYETLTETETAGSALDLDNVIQTYRYGISYEEGLMKGYTENIENNYENFLYTKTRSGISYNELRQAYSWREETETQDTTGSDIGDYYHTKVRVNRIKTLYNQSGLEMEYEEERENLPFIAGGEEKDRQDNVKVNTKFTGIKYNSEDLLESFTRRDTYTGDMEEDGDLDLDYWVETKWQAGSYNDLNQSESCNEEIESSVTSEITTNAYSSINYDENGRRKNYLINSNEVELEYDNYGSIKREIMEVDNYTTIETEVKSRDYYYYRPLMVEKTVTTRDEDGVQLRKVDIKIERVSSGDYYNSLGQQLNIKLTIDGEIIEQRDITYNTKGQFISYTSGSTKMKDGQYSGTGEFISYKEEISSNHYIEWKDPTYTNGKLYGYSEIETEDGVVKDITWSAHDYDQYGRIKGYTKTEDGIVIEESAEVTFDNVGQYIKFLPLDIISTSSEIKLSSIPVTQKQNIYISPIINLFNNSTKIIASIFEPIVKTLEDQAIKLLSSLSINMQTFHTAITKRTSTDYNELDQVVGYKEKVTEIGGTLSIFNGTIATTTITKEIERSGIEYNKLGQMIFYEEKETDQKGNIKTSERDIEYNDFGFVGGYEESRFELGIEKHEDVSNLTYNKQGQLVTYLSVLEEKAESLNTEGIPIQYALTTITERLNTVYTTGGLVDKLKETVWTLDTPAITTTIEKTGIRYNAYGEISGLIETITKKGEDLLVTTVSKKSNLQYTAVGNLLSFEEEITSSLAPDLVTIHNWSGAAYNPSGELIGYTETYRKKDSDLIKQIRKTGIKYDPLGRLKEFTLIEREYSPTMDTMKITVRKDTQYNPLHQLLGYEETITSGGITEEIVFKVFEHDLVGRIKGSITESNVTGQPKVTKTSYTTYNDYGRITDSKDVITRDDSTDITQTLTLSNINYNTLGQTDGYIQTSEYKGSFVNYSITTTRSNSLYDEYGRLESYDESDDTTAKHVALTYNTYDQLYIYTEGGKKYGDIYHYYKTSMLYDNKGRLSTYNEKNDGQYEDSSATISLTYDDQNRVENRYETGTDRKGAYTLNTTGIKYTDFGQQKSYIQEKTQNGITTITTRYDTVYNVETGLVSNYAETTESPLGKSTRNVTINNYDEKTRITNFSENGTNEDGSTYNITHNITEYDNRQRIISFTEFGNSSQIGDYNYTRSNIVYDNFNRITNYSEEGKNSQTGSYKFDKSIEYDGLDRVINASEKNGWRENGGNYNSTRTINAYDSLGRVTDFAEDGWTQGQGNYNLHRYNIQYKARSDLAARGTHAVHGSGEGLTSPLSYTETGWQEGKGTYHTEKSNIQYYENGTLKSFHEKTNSSDGSTIEFDRTSITYNANGQITGFSENGNRTGMGNYSLTRSGIIYNAIGQITEYKESGSNWDGNYSYHRHSIGYYGDGRISEYRENGTDTKGRGYSLHRYSMNYHGNGLLASYSENSNEGHRDVWAMSYDGNGQLIRQEVRTDKDQFQFGGHSTYTFSYDGNGNLTQTRIDTNDYWVTFDKNGNQTGFGYSAQMQNYINELQRQAEEAEREAEWEMRNAEDLINEAVEAERRAMEEEAAATVVRTETVTVKRGRNKYDVITRYWYADGSYTEDVQRVKGRSNAKREAEKARRKSQQLIGQAREKVEEAKHKKEEAERQADRARGQASWARERAEESKRLAERRRGQAISAAAVSREKAEKAKEQAIKAKEKVTTTVSKIEITRTKNSDGSTTVILTNKITGARRELRFDSFGDMTYKQAKNAKGEITHFETHQYTRDSRGRITSDTYHKEITTVTSQPIGKPIKYTDKDGNTKTYQRTQQQRDKVIESGTVSYNKYGQVTSADIKRRVITDISKGGDKWKNVSDYTMEIKLTTEQDSMGRVTAEHETTHIFGKEGYQDKSGKWKSKDVDYTINRDRTYNYDGNSILPSG